MKLIDIAYFGLAFIVGWWLIWYLIAIITGFHLKSISINNGISFNGLSFTSKKLDISLKSLRFRLWGNTRKLILDDLIITLLDPNSHKNHQNKDNSSSKSNSKPKTRFNSRTHSTPSRPDRGSAANGVSPDQGSNDKSTFDPASVTLQILPHNRFVKPVVKFLLRHIPKIDVEIRNTTFTNSYKFKTHIDYTKFSLLSRKSNRHDHNMKFYFNLTTTNIQIRNTAAAFEKVPPSSLANFRFQLNYSINLLKGEVQNIQLKVFMGDVKVSIFNTVKYFIKKLGNDLNGFENEDRDEDYDIGLSDESDSDDEELFPDSPQSPHFESKPKTSRKAPTTSNFSSDDSKFQNRLNKLVRLHNKIYSAINEVSVHVENSVLLEIPFATTEDNQTFTEYFKQSHPKTSVSLNIKSMSVNFQKLYEGSAGFEVLFDPKIDKPFHLTSSVQLLKLDYSKLVYDEKKRKYFTESDEVLSIPNYSFNFKTNIMDNLANGYGFKNCVMQLFSSASSPILDVDTVQLSSLIYNLVLLKKFVKLTELKRRNRKLAKKLSKIDLYGTNDGFSQQQAYGYSDNGTPNLKSERSVRENEAGEVRKEQERYNNRPSASKSTKCNEDNSDTSTSKELDDELEETKVELDYDRTPPHKKVPNQSGNSESSHIKTRIIKLLNDYYPRLDVKLIIEQPRLIIRNKDKLTERIQILNFSYSLLNVHTVTTEARDYDAKCHILHPCTTYHEKSDVESSNYSNEIIRKEILSLRSAHIQIDILKNLRVKSLIDIDEALVDLSHLDVLVGINRLLLTITNMTDVDMKTGLINLFLNSEIIKQRSVYPILSPGYKSSTPPVSESSRLSDHDGQPHTTTQSKLEAKIFRFIPSWLLEAELHISYSHFLLGSRSVLIPKEYLSQVSGNGFENDTGNSNNNLRSIKLTFDDLRVSIKNDKHKSLKSSHSNSSSADVNGALSSSVNTSSDTLTSVTPDSSSFTKYWLFNVKVNQILSVVKTDLKNDGFEHFFGVPNLSIDVSAVKDHSENKLKVDGTVDELKLIYDRYKYMTILGVVYLLKEIFVNPVQLIRAKVRNDMRRFASDANIHARHIYEKRFKDFLYCEFVISKSNLTLHLSDEFRIKVQLFDLLSTLIKGVLKIDNKFMRVLADSPTIEGFWSRLVCVDGLSCIINEPSSDHKVQVNSVSIRLIQPHAFVVHQLFDNLSITLKTCKHLLHAMKGTSSEKLKIVKPKESKTIKLPKINIASKKLTFTMEDDPFESKLNMIYQLGLTEQRKRLEQFALFEERAIQELDENHEVDIEEKYMTLLSAISASWIRKVKVYREKTNDEIVANKKYLFGNEVLLSKQENSKVVAYTSEAPLLSLIMDGFDLNLSTPRFDLHDLPQFIHDLGQGVPKDTKYSLMFPSHIQLNLTELRMHLRDYPLPLLHLPRDPDNKSLSMEGHLIVAESLVKEIEHLRKLYIPLARNLDNVKSDKHYALTIEKSLSTVKMYTDIKVKFGSKLPSRFVWGQSYQFGIQQIMLNFDQFSKPPVDPSMKLGFWDKLRLIMHGKFKIETGPNNGLEVAFKGSRDPYDLFDVSSGFVLAFSNNVQWDVNKDDDSRSFFDIKSDKVSWYIPNYLSSPLLSWTRDSSKFVYLPNNKEFITSCFAYYLDDTTKDFVTPEDLQADLIEKQVLNLQGGVRFKVGFILQRTSPTNSDEVTEKCKPHYDIDLYNPDFTGHDHDSYAGFRSDRIHMAISLAANTEDSYNAIHLSPGVFKQFFSWWKLFSGNMMLPIRRGKMFGELKKAMKFSQHLFTNKFQFTFKSFFLSHLYRDETVDSDQDTIECVGLKAKMDEFMVDLHQRKEPRIEVHEGLSRNKQIMKMNFNIGEVHLSGIDLRMVYGIFEQDIYSIKKMYDESKSQYNVFDDDVQWFDIQDYEEAYIPSLSKSGRKINIFPLMYSKRFSYLRDTDVSGNDNIANNQLGSEATHECLLKSTDVFGPQIEIFADRIEQLKEQMKSNRTKNYSNKSLHKRVDALKRDIEECKQKRKRFIRKGDPNLEAAEARENFHNRFVLISMFLKWNVDNRNLLLKYVHFVQLKSAFRKYLSYESISTIEELIQQTDKGLSMDDMSSFVNSTKQQKLGQGNVPNTRESSQERFEKFDEIIRRVKDNESITEDFLIEIISPQIQLQSDDAPDSVVLIAAPSIDAKIISVVDKKANSMVLNDKELEIRYGVMLKDANIFVIDKEDTKRSNNLILNKTSYGTKTNWPPWLGAEICKNGVLAGKDKLLVEETSLVVTYDQTKPLANKLSQVDESPSESQSMEQGASGNDGVINDQPESISNRLRVDIPTFVISSTSKQYFTLYIMVISLLFYSEPMSKSLSEKLEKLKFSIDFQDLRALHANLTSMHKYYQLMNLLSNNYSFRQSKLDNERLNDYLMLNIERGNVVTDIYLMMQSILTGDMHQTGTNSQPQAEWIIRADQIILHMLEDDRTPILDIAMAQGNYRRIIKEDSSNDNQLRIKMMQGFNLLPDAHYQGFLEPLEDPNKHGDDENLVSVDWSMNRSVGGIKIMEKFEINSQPLNLKIDEITGEKLMNYIFRTELESLDESPLLKSKDSESDGESDEDDGSSRRVESVDSKTDGFVDQLDGTNRSVKFDKETDSQTTGAKRNNNRSISKLSNNQESISPSGDSGHTNESDVDEMVQRAKKFISIVSLKANPFLLSISIKCTKGYRRALNVEDLRITLPELVIQQEIMSFLEVTMMMKKLIIKTLLSHTGRLVKNKMTVKRKSGRKFINKPLKPLKKYVKFTQVSELAEQGSVVNSAQ